MAHEVKAMSVLEVIEEVKSLAYIERREFWRRLSEIGPEFGEDPGSDAEVFSLQKVAPKRKYAVKVKYNFVGKGKPQPFPLK